MTDNRSKGRFVTIGDEYQREIITREEPRITPTVDICAEPTYTITINQKWAAHIFGAIATLALPQAWSGEENERNTAVQQIMKLLAMECSPPMDCEQVASCIATSELVQQTINQYFSTTNQNGGAGNINLPLPENKLNEVWYTDETCDSDALWGACEEIIDGMFDATLELLQKLNQTTTVTDLFAELLEAIPLVGGLLSFGYEVSTWAIETALPLFLAVDSALVRRELACDLFCLCKEECDLSMNKVIDVFNSAGVEEPPWSTEILPNLEWMIELALSGNPDKAVAASIATLGIMVVKYGGRFGKIVLGVDSYQQMAAYGAAINASAGWEIYCDCPDEWTEVFDFTQSSDGWSIKYFEGGVYVPLQGWVGNQMNNGIPPNVRVGISHLATDLAVITGLTGAKIEYDLTKGTYYSNNLFARGIQATPNDPIFDNVLFTQAGEVTKYYNFAPVDTDNGFWFFLMSKDNDSGPPGSTLVTKITLWGVGSNPFD